MRTRLPARHSERARAQDAVTQELVGVSQIADGAMHLVRTICQRTAWPMARCGRSRPGAGTHLERVAFWSELASGRPKTCWQRRRHRRAAARSPSVSWAAAKVCGRTRGWGGRQKWRTVFACPLEAHRAVGVRAVRSRTAPARRASRGPSRVIGRQTRCLDRVQVGRRPAAPARSRVPAAFERPAARPGTTNAGVSLASCTIRRPQHAAALLMNLGSHRRAPTSRSTRGRGTW